MAKLLITVPNTGWIHKTVCDALDVILCDPRHQKVIMRPVASPPLDNNLNLLAETFYSNDFDYWLTLDDDTAPKRNPLDLVGLGKDVIGMPYPMVQEGHGRLFFPCTFKLEDTKHVPYEGKGLERVDAIGGGAMLISRRVFDCMEMRKYPFLSIYNEKGHRTLGPDLSFCGRLRANGFEIYAHYDYPCTHFKEINIGRFVGVM